jgi:hypothetical protein
MRIRPNKLPPPPFEEIDESKKYCTYCGILKELEHFHVDRSKPDGHRDHCIDCRKAIRAEENALAIPLANMEEQAIETLDSLSSSGGSMTPHSSEALEAIIKPFGGVEGLGKWMFATFLAARPGSAIRERLLSRVIDLIEMNTERGDASVPLERMEDADLVRIMSINLIEYQKKASLPSNAIPTIDGKLVDAKKVVNRG